MSKVIIIRGNSGSGKTTVSKKLCSVFGYDTMLLSQDVVRRDILHTKDGDGSIAVQALIELVRFGKSHSNIIIIEGILNSNWYKPLFDYIKSNFTDIYSYYYDIPFDETIKRFHTKQGVNYTVEQMKKWWNEKDYLGFDNEKILSVDMSVEDVVRLITDDVNSDCIKNDSNEIWDIYDKNRNLTGRTVKRGKPMNQDEYHIVVNVCIRNSKGQWLISKRAENKHLPLMWEFTGGSAVAGEDSLTASIREVKEELGLKIDKNKMHLFKTGIRQYRRFPDFCDIWVALQDFDIDNVVLQKEEVCDAMWASSNEVKKLISNNEFVPMNEMPFYEELFNKYG